MGKNQSDKQTPVLLRVENLKKNFGQRAGFWGKSKGVTALNGVSFDLNRAQTLGIVGESGCGKSTLGRCVLRLQEPDSGKIEFEGEDIVGATAPRLKQLRRDMQIIFQDPYASLSPRLSIREILEEPLITHGFVNKVENLNKIKELLEFVGMSVNALQKFPHEFSGGQRQRIGIARALMLKPKFIVADEPVSALDVSVQAQVLNLVSDLQKELGISFIFIAHDLAVVQHISHQVGVMYLGHMVELANAEDLYANPKHPYTKALLSAVPTADPALRAKRAVLKGEIPSASALPSGCPFRTRCPQAMDKCKESMPIMKTVSNTATHQVACHLY